MSGEPIEAKDNLIALAVSIVSSYVANNQVPQSELPNILTMVHRGLAALGGDGETATNGGTPAVPVKKSVTEDFIICLEDGKKLRTLKRYLMTQYDMTPEQYRAKWNLPRDYPMVAPSYTKLRSAFAKKIGLGRIEKGTTTEAIEKMTGDTLFAYLCNDRGQGDEIIGCIVPGLGSSPVPMVFANERVARLMRFIAAEHGARLRKPVQFVKFTNREVLETI